MEELREYRFRVESRDVDFMKRATVMALGDYVLHTAGEDADANGFGVRELNATHNSSWVLTRMAMEVLRMPDEYEELTIQTWVSEVSRVMTTRNFRVFGRGREPIASAVTNWAMINLDTRRPMDLYTLNNYNGMTQAVASPVDMPRRLTVPEEEKRYNHTVVYSDVDFNCHANSMKYLQWVVDTLPLEELSSKRFARIDINFIQESLHGQDLSIISGREEDGQLFEIRNAEEKPVCRIAFSLRQHFYK